MRTAGDTALLTSVEVDELADHQSALSITLQWIRHFLAQPHPDLGRNGPVCPFVPSSLTHNRLWLAAVESDSQDESHLESIVDGFRSVFLELEPQVGADSITKSIVIVFPRVTDELAPALIDGLQARLKPAFVDDGLMLGQFHRLSTEPGLWNPDFRPLRSPIPLLAIRFMVGGDIAFLSRATDPVHLRLRFLSGYVNATQKYRWPSKWSGEAVRALGALVAELEALAADPAERDLAERDR